ncbi:MAG: hypothetical protein DCC49_03390 [Acidobacteria bacterium]|nr:MAG: hypothetical protein DCC49_03390 [Acidobacteriota bacterium]
MILAGVFMLLLLPVGSANAAGSGGFSVTPPGVRPAPANTSKKSGSQQSSSPSKLSDNQKKQAAKEAELSAAKQTDLELEASLKALDTQLGESEQKLVAARARSEKADSDVADVKESISQSQAEVEKHTTSVNASAVDIYKHPDRGSVDAILGSENISDAGRRVGMVNRVIEADQSQLRRLSALKQDLKEDEDRLVAAQEEARSAKEAQEHEQERLETLKVKQEATLKANEARIRQLQSEVDALEKEEAAIQATLARSGAATPGAGPQGNVNVRGNGKFGWPVGGPVTSEFGQRCLGGSCRMHNGIDISAPTGTRVGAAGSGTVISAGSQGGYGNTVIINHGDGYATLYGHLSSISVTSGQSVGRGTIVGTVGSTGHSTGPHLHFEVRVGGSAQNPRLYL